MMDAAVLLDALVAAGVLFALGGVIAIGGRVQDSHQRAIGAFVSLGGLAVAAVAVGAWHGSAWGQAVALVLLVVGGGSCTLVPHRAGLADSSHPTDDADEVRP